jgi:dTDP-4-amino-4,6-dideoxygalactose transaminase
MKPIFIASTPNFEKDDIDIVKNILNGKISEDEYSNSKKYITEFFENTFGKKTYFLNTGRAGLYEILKSTGIKEGDEVILQAMTCLAVPLPILWHKAKPIYADINPKTYSISLEDVKKKITNKTKAIIVTHMFGKKLELKEFKQYLDELNSTRKNKIFLIEDCAHILDPKMEIYGDYAFFSFAQDKPISCMTGGVVLGNLKTTQEAEKNIPLEEMSERESKKILKSILLWEKIKKTYYKPFGISKISLGKFLILFARRFGLTQSAANPEDLFNKPEIKTLSKYFHPLLKNQLNKLEKFNNNRRQISKIYGNEDIYLRYPIQCERSEALRAALRNEKVIIGNWYNNPVYPRGIDMSKFGYVDGSCPVVEKLSKNILNLPTNIGVEEEEARNIKDIVNNFLN